MKNHTTLSKFLILHLSNSKAESDLAALLIDVAATVKMISTMTSKGSLGGFLEEMGSRNIHGECQKRLDLLANEAMIENCEQGGQLAGITTDGLESPYLIPDAWPRGQYLLAFNPLDGSSNTDVNVSVGTIFSVLRYEGTGQEGQQPPSPQSYFQAGKQQVAAGYAIYGPSTMLVITVGNGTHGFTLDREVGNFILTHPDIHIPQDTNELAINSSNEPYWEPPVQRYISECKAGKTGIRQQDFNMRWIASIVADVHRVLMRGGVFMYPLDSRQPIKSGHLRFLCEGNPLAMVVTQAGGLASTGRERIANVEINELHQRVPVIFGSANEVERIERYHAEYEAGTDQEYVSPLFKERSLYRE